MSLIKSKIYSLAWLKAAIYISVMGGVILSSTRVLAAYFAPPTADLEERLSLTVRQDEFVGERSSLELPTSLNWAATFFINQTQGNRDGYDSMLISVVLRHLADPHQGENGGGEQLRLDFLLDSRNPRNGQKSVADSDFGFHSGRRHVDRARGVLTANITTNGNGSTDISNWNLTLNASHNVPEPLTMLGAATALKYGALLKRKYSENKKS
jgi:hypothetical protein